VLCEEDLTPLERTLSEDKHIHMTYIMAGIYSLLWALFGRPDWFDMGGSMVERWQSFLDLLGSDRFTFASTVEIFLFSVFQGWLVDDDWAMRMRRGRRGSGGGGDDGKWLTDVAKYVPFLGLGWYMMARPPLPSEKEVFGAWMGVDRPQGGEGEGIDRW